jgi:hypothetical protein
MIFFLCAALPPGFWCTSACQTLGEVLISTDAIFILRPEKGLEMGINVTIFRYFLIDRVSAAISILVTTGNLR